MVLDITVLLITSLSMTAFLFKLLSLIIVVY